MEVVSALPAATWVWQSRGGPWSLAVVCKATFHLAPGDAHPAAEHDPLATVDQHWDDDDTRSLFAASDLVPFKRRVDVLLVGHAFAPGGQRVHSLVARMKVADLDKSVLLFADRAVGSDGSIFPGRGFTRMPLVYERAAGGPSTSNPVGVHGVVRDAYGHATLPNLVVPGSSPNEIGEPIGFGALRADWPPRRDQWASREPPAVAPEVMPDGVDPAFFNVAPPDQRLEVLPDRIAIELENLHPEHPHLSCVLAWSAPRVTFENPAGRRTVAMRADTLVIDSDRGLATIAWRGQIDVADRDPIGRVVVESESPPPTTARQTFERSDTREIALNESRGPLTVQLAPTTRRQDTQTGPTTAVAALPFAAQPPLGPPAVEFNAPPLAPPVPAPPLSPSVAPSPPITPSPPLAALSPATPAPPSPAPRVAPSVPAPRASSPVHVDDAGRAWSPAAFPVPPPPPALVAPHHAADAARGGLVEASNAAADASPAPPAVQSVESGPADLLFLWAAPDLAGRLRKRPEWKRILDARERQAAAGRRGDPSDDDDVAAVLAAGTPASEASLPGVLKEGHQKGRFAPQLALVAGEVTFAFDELETLRAAVSIATSLPVPPEELRSAVDLAKSYLETSKEVSAPPVTAGLTKRIREAIAGWDARPVSPTFLDEMIEVALLEKRAYRKRDLFGETVIAARLLPAGSTTSIPIYFLETVSKRLPPRPRLGTRVIVEVHHRVDPGAESPVVLRAAALALDVAL